MKISLVLKQTDSDETACYMQSDISGLASQFYIKGMNFGILLRFSETQFASFQNKDNKPTLSNLEQWG